MSGPRRRNRFRFRLIALTLLALIGGLGSCIGSSGEQSEKLADPIGATSVVPSTTTSVSRPPSTPTTSARTSSTQADPPTTTSTPRARTSTRTTTPAPRRLVPDVDAPAPSTTTTTSKRSEPSANPGSPVYYANCSAVQAAGAAPIRRGDPGYRSALDRDGDGQGCAGD